MPISSNSAAPSNAISLSARLQPPPPPCDWMPPRAPRHPVDPSPTNDTARRALAAAVLGVTCALMPVRASFAQTWATLDVRSEEHTSELQSHSDLVCRLLLEKKKN